MRTGLKAMLYDVSRAPDGTLVYKPLTSGVYLSASAIANTLGVCQQTVYNWVDSGKLKALRFGSLLRVEVEEFRRFIAEARDAEYEIPAKVDHE